MNSFLPNLARRSRLAPWLFAGSMIFLAPSPACFGVSTLYLRPDGNDQADGRSREHALRTLVRAQEICRQEGSQPQENVEVIIGAGRYARQSVVWTYTAPDHTVAFIGENRGGERTIFSGPAADHKAFFVLRASAGKSTNLRFKNLTITDYDSAISLEGDRETTDAFNSDNVIESCSFYRIGNKFTGTGHPATAAVRMVNSRHNRVQDCAFDRVENSLGSPIDGRADAGQRMMHSIYLAHLSSGNLIVRCRFGDNSGDAIKIRDASNDIQIEDNIFLDRSGADAAADDWFANSSAGIKSTKKNGIECPSWRVTLRNNRLGRVSYDGKALLSYRVHFETQRRPCEPHPDSARYTVAGEQRLSAAEAQSLLDQLRQEEPGPL